MLAAVLSDIHGNVFALEAVLEDARARGATHLFNLGDTLYGPIAPKATFELLQEHNVVSISGNQDRQILEAAVSPEPGNPTMDFVLKDLGREPLNWLQPLAFECLINETLYLCHGSPSSDLEYLLENVETGFPRVRRDKEIRDALAGRTAPVILCGHTHIPRTVALGSGQLVVNPGSVGLPAYTDDAPVAHSMETHSPHASYALIEQCRTGWMVRQLRIPYDHHKAVKAAQAQQRADWAYALETGRS